MATKTRKSTTRSTRKKTTPRSKKSTTAKKSTPKSVSFSNVKKIRKEAYAKRKGKTFAEILSKNRKGLQKVGKKTGKALEALSKYVPHVAMGLAATGALGATAAGLSPIIGPTVSMLIDDTVSAVKKMHHNFSRHTKDTYDEFQSDVKHAMHKHADNMAHSYLNARYGMASRPPTVGRADMDTDEALPVYQDKSAEHFVNVSQAQNEAVKQNLSRGTADMMDVYSDGSQAAAAKSKIMHMSNAEQGRSQKRGRTEIRRVQTGRKLKAQRNV